MAELISSLEGMTLAELDLAVADMAETRIATTATQTAATEAAVRTGRTHAQTCEAAALTTSSSRGSRPGVR